MEGDGYVPVSRPAKPGAEPTMTPNERDALERQLACPCPCTLDIFTCRTSMPTCGFSPRIHRDVLGLVEGGYSAQEIMATFKDAYGEHILMAPTKQGFNLVGWFAPATLIGAGAVGILVLLRSWRRPAHAAAHAQVHPIGVEASDDELARLEAAVRRDEP
jgi:cytochrome c-type biogenesis protein CcmH